MYTTVIFVILAVTSSGSSLKNLHDEWESFKIRYGKQYKDYETDLYRKTIFVENMLNIIDQNQKKGSNGFKLGVNQFTDMLPSEVARGSGATESRNSTKIARVETESVRIGRAELPSSIDWRPRGAVTQVKDLQECVGASYAFSATGSIEGQLYLKTGRLVSLSEQHIIDCSSEYGNQGCKDGLVSNSFEYIQSTQGINPESIYPFKGEEDECHYDSAQIAGVITGYRDVAGGVIELQEAVARVGPISVLIDASDRNFQAYAGGIYLPQICDSPQHWLLVVGYETEGGKDYWILKNSWGTEWGENGYMRMIRNNGNDCGITDHATYPLV